MTDLESFTTMLDNQKDESARYYNRCEGYKCGTFGNNLTMVALDKDKVEFLFDCFGRFVGVRNTALW